MKFINLLLIFLSAANFIYADQTQDPVIEFMSNYKRSFTVLEIGKNAKTPLYAHKIVNRSNITDIVILFSESEILKQNAAKHNYQNIVILEPYDLDTELFRNLGRCEHFDLVIIHTDIYPLVRKSWDQYLNRFCALGDHIIFDVNLKTTTEINKKNLLKSFEYNLNQLNNYEDHLFFIYKSNRKGLDIARWNKRFQSEQSTPRYGIESDFCKKLFIKPGNKALPWVDGINLSTFVMLRGIYPTDAIITNSIENMSKNMPYHNDLIIGNIIIQGHKLVPIDFADSRRNANMANLLQRAYNVFNGDGRRLKDPIKRMRIYSKKKK